MKNNKSSHGRSPSIGKGFNFGIEPQMGLNNKPLPEFYDTGSFDYKSNISLGESSGCDAYNDNTGSYNVKEESCNMCSDVREF